jgi:threonine dehydrogenase-like Zn-dependent dehydrogenase
MRAAVIEQDHLLVVKDVPEPMVGDYDALCQIVWGATCSGTDLHLIDGSLPFRSPLPTILGHESVGRVTRLGPKVRYLRPGDLVTRVGATPAGGYSVSWGGFAELGIARDYRAMQEDGLPQSAWRTARWNRALPAWVDPRVATLIITWRETLSYLTRMGFAAGKTLLVIGSGGNGLSYATHARNLGAASVAMIGAAAREERARRVGVAHYFDYRSERLAERVGEFYPEGFDFVIDALGRVGVADLGLALVKSGGTLTIYGVDDYNRCTLVPTRARGSFSFYNGGYDEGETHERVLLALQQGKLDASVWLDLEHAFALEQINAAFDAVRARAVVKALVRIAG